MRILFIGDIFGKPGRRALKNLLPAIKERFSPDFVIANSENAAHGAGLTEKIVNEIFSAGVDIQTGGNHSFDKRAFWAAWDRYPRVIRPANFPDGVPGNGFAIVEKNSMRLAVINLMGRVTLPPTLSPFDTADKLVEKLKQESDAILIDFHAEATSEKMVFGMYMDGKVAATVGTHTHVQTADARVLKKGTAYITDVGMCGVWDSAIGLDYETVLEKFKKLIPYPLKIAEGIAKMDFVVIDVDKNGKAERIENYTYVEEGNREED